MSYALDMARSASTTFRGADFETQEAVLDLLERLAAEDPHLLPVVQSHRMRLRVPPRRTDVFLSIRADHTRRLLTLAALGWVTARYDPR